MLVERFCVGIVMSLLVAAINFVIWGIITDASNSVIAGIVTIIINAILIGILATVLLYQTGTIYTMFR